MNSILENCRLINKIEIREGLFDFTVCAPKVTSSAKPGQFINIKCGDEFTLRRPISICDVIGHNLRFIFEIRGEGTEKLSFKEVGESIDILGPLGKPFTLIDTDKKAIFVGGGIGIFPLLFHAKYYGINATVILGFRNADIICMIEDFISIGAKVLIATDDGSAGHKGFVTDLLRDEIKGAGSVFACGPAGMLKKTAEIAELNDVFCEVSMEQRMGCGIGACLVCACKSVKNGKEFYSHVCKDGPVYNSKEVVF